MTAPDVGVVAISAIAVAVPARNEADRIVPCVAALSAAVEQVGLPVCVVVCADNCSDGTAELARSAFTAAGLNGQVIEIAAGSAGVARQAASEGAVAQLVLADHLRHEIWLASTDADSRVAPSWLRRQLRWARTGLAGVSGLVTLAEVEARVAYRYDRFITRQGARFGHSHIHGANLGVRADWWTRVGGFPSVRCGEDQQLWRRLAAAGAETVGVTDLGVTTSGRTEGRASGGLAQLLATLDEVPAIAIGSIEARSELEHCE